MKCVLKSRIICSEETVALSVTLTNQPPASQLLGNQLVLQGIIGPVHKMSFNPSANPEKMSNCGIKWACNESATRWHFINFDWIWNILTLYKLTVIISHVCLINDKLTSPSSQSNIRWLKVGAKIWPHLLRSVGPDPETLNPLSAGAVVMPTLHGGSGLSSINPNFLLQSYHSAFLFLLSCPGLNPFTRIFWGEIFCSCRISHIWIRSVRR